VCYYSEPSDVNNAFCKTSFWLKHLCTGHI